MKTSRKGGSSSMVVWRLASSIIIGICICHTTPSCLALSMVVNQKQQPLDGGIRRSLSLSPSPSSRRSWIQAVAATAAVVVTTTATTTFTTSPAQATDTAFTDEQLKEIVTSDVLDRQFLVTGKLTKDIYLPTATFTDEIDTYSLDQWIKGTQKLFVGDSSQVRLEGGAKEGVRVSPESVEFRFDEDLMFRLPLSLRPVVKLSGKVVLTRDKETGLISSYREFWDQDVATVLKSAKF